MTSLDEPDNGYEQPPLRPGTVWLLGLLLLSLLTIAATWALVPAKYRSEAWIECVSNRPKVPESVHQPKMQEKQHERFINDQVARIKSPDVLSVVLKTAEVRRTEWYKQVDGKRLVEQLEHDLHTAVVPDTNYVRIAMACREPSDPATIVGQVVRNYLTFVRDRAKNRYRNELAEYKDEADDLELQIRAKIQQIREFTATLPAGSTATGGGIAYERLVRYTDQVAALELETMELEGLLQMLKDPAGPAVSPEQQQLAEQDPRIVRLKDEVLSLELDLLTLGAGQPEDEAAPKELTARLQAVRQKLGELRTQKLAEVHEWRVRQVRDAFVRAQHALFVTRGKLAEAEAAQSDLDRKAAERQTQQDELEYLKTSRTRANEYIRKLRQITSERGQAVQINVVQMPSEPTDPDRDPHYLVTGASLAVPLLFGVCLGFKRAVLRRRAPQST
ncbi:MAG: hypothetical protein GY778_07920 [bacterium]|nr:hypothetical protein [bacterium]